MMEDLSQLVMDDARPRSVVGLYLRGPAERHPGANHLPGGAKLRAVTFRHPPEGQPRHRTDLYSTP